MSQKMERKDCGKPCSSVCKPNPQGHLPVLWIILTEKGHIELYEKRICHDTQSLYAPHLPLNEAGAYLEKAYRQGKFGYLVLVGSRENIAALRQHLSPLLQMLVMADIERSFNGETSESLRHKLDCLISV